MTRINVGYNPKNLTTKHLLAEHREIKRIPNTIKSGKAVIKDIPEQFCLGKGHVKFFYNKLNYLLNRYKKIYQECIDRGYKVENYEKSWSDIDKSLFGNYEPTQQDKQLIIDRINKKLNLI